MKKNIYATFNRESQNVNSFFIHKVKFTSGKEFYKVSEVEVRNVRIESRGRFYPIGQEDVTFNYKSNSIDIFVNPHRIGRNKSRVIVVVMEFKHKESSRWFKTSAKYIYVPENHLDKLSRKQNKKAKKRGYKK